MIKDSVVQGQIAELELEEENIQKGDVKRKDTWMILAEFNC